VRLPFGRRREPAKPSPADPDVPLTTCMFAVRTDSGSTTYVAFTRAGPEIEVRNKGEILGAVSRTVPEIEVKNQGEILGTFASAELLAWLMKAEPFTALRSKQVSLQTNPMTGMTITIPGVNGYELSGEDRHGLFQVLTGF
jgi:hypothetical protein